MEKSKKKNKGGGKGSICTGKGQGQQIREGEKNSLEKEMTLSWARVNKKRSCTRG